MMFGLGTDTKIAKFLKKGGGIEFIEVALFEPSHLLPLSHSLSRTPSTSALEPSSPIITGLLSTSAPSASASSFFSKFKKISLRRGKIFAKERQSGFERKASQENMSGGRGGVGEGNEGMGGGNASIVPLFRPDSNSHSIRASSLKGSNGGGNSSTRKYGYVWTVRKWLRDDLEGRNDLVELRFEWKRGSKQSIRNPRSASRMSTTSSTRPRSTRSIRSHHSGRNGGGADDLTLPIPISSTMNQQHLSPDSRSRSRSPSPNNGGGQRHATSDSDHDGGESDSDESDPEDSERPWTCTLIHSSSSSASSPLPITNRIMVAQLTPAPHHPKLVASLAMPFLLKSISLNEERGSELTVEEVKDIVCVTALWLVVKLSHK